MIEYPVYDFPIFSTGKTIKYRPFFEKERKVLLMALESKSDKEIMDAIRRIIKACIVEPEDFDINTLASFDLDMLFLNLRARSIGEKATPSYSCKHVIDGKECNGTIECEIDLMNVKLQIDKSHNKLINFNGNIGVMMKYPTLELMETMKVGESETDANIDFIVNCVDYIFDTDNIYNEETKEDIEDFLMNLTSPNFDRVEAFFTTMPRLEEKLEKNCPKCNFLHTIILDDVQSFFE